jgi:hypothetical protein
MHSFGHSLESYLHEYMELAAPIGPRALLFLVGTP